MPKTEEERNREEEFLKACRDPNISSEILKEYIKKGVDVNCIDSIGENGLHKACYEGNFAKIKFLVSIEDIAPFFLVSSNGKSVLHIACENNQNLNVIQYLYETLKDIHFISYNENLNNNNENIININDENNILTKIIHLKDLYEETIFHKACKNSNLQILQYILSIKGINIHDNNKGGRNGFLIAISHNSNEKIPIYLHKNTLINIYQVNCFNYFSAFSLLSSNPKLILNFKIWRYLMENQFDRLNSLNQSNFYQLCKTLYTNHKKNIIMEGDMNLLRYLVLSSVYTIQLPRKDDRENEISQNELKTEWKKMFQLNVITTRSEILCKDFIEDLRHCFTSPPFQSFCSDMLNIISS